MANKKDNKTDNKAVIKKLIGYISKYLFLLVLSIIFAFISSVAALYIPVLIGESVDYIVGPGQVDFTNLMSYLYKIAIIVGVTAICQWLMNVCNNRLTVQVVRDVRKDAFEKIQKLPLSYVDSHPHGDIVSRVIADVDTFADGLLMGFSQFFTGIVTILGTLVFMAMVNIKVTVLVVVLTPLSLFVASFIAKKTHKFFVDQSKIRSKQTTFIDEMISGAKVVKAFGHEENAVSEFNEINDELEKCSLKAVFYSSTVNPSTRFINSLVYASVALYGGFLCIGSIISVGQLTCLLSYANQYTKPFNEISNVITELQNALACAGRIFELLDEKVESSDKDSMILADVSGNVNIDQVDFSYDKSVKLIEDFNLSVPQGKRVAIVGPTGCGKTTIINLLMRFYEPDKGSIVIDGKNINDVTRNSLRENYGMVLQETWLCHGTIRDNIAMGRKDATEEEIINAAKACHADSFIRKLPNGYDTQIGDDLGGLSEGQRQLLCIARVMIALPPMLILDEATSSIDTRTELKIQSAFAKLMTGRTSFIVAHRLSTIKTADIILVMQAGKIIEMGNHDSLIEKGGFYKNLYTSQFAAAE